LKALLFYCKRFAVSKCGVSLPIQFWLFRTRLIFKFVQVTFSTVLLVIWVVALPKFFNVNMVFFATCVVAA